jgi:uncharacterized membrane protein YeaQ/YmgE (transglycosylase-associated protein family)
MLSAQPFLAAVTFHTPSSIIGWVIVGLIAGWAASHVMDHHGSGVIGDVIVGLIGAAIGGVIVGFFWAGSTGFIGSIVIAFIGACILLWLMGLLSAGHVASRV